MNKESFSPIEAMEKLSVYERYYYFIEMGIPLSIVTRIDLENRPEDCVYFMNNELRKHNCSLTNLSGLTNPKLAYSELLLRASMVSQEKRVVWLRSHELRPQMIKLVGSPVNFLFEVKSELRKLGKTFADLSL